MDALLHLDLRGVEIPQIPPELEWDVVALLGWHLRDRKRVAAELLRRYWTVRLLCRWQAVERRRASGGDEAAALDRGMTWAPWLLAYGNFLGADKEPLPLHEACEAMRTGQVDDLARWLGIEPARRSRGFMAWRQAVVQAVSSTETVERLLHLVSHELSNTLLKGLRGVAVWNWGREHVSLRATIRAALLYMGYELWVFKAYRDTVYGPEALGEAVGLYTEVMAMGANPASDSWVQQDLAEAVNLLRKDGRAYWIDVTRWVLERPKIEVEDIIRRVAGAREQGIVLYL